MVLLRERTRPGLGIIEPCLPSPAKAPPSGPDWLHEIKHDGLFRILARHGPVGVRLVTRAGNDFSSQFSFIAMAVAKLPVRSCLIDGEACVCDDNGLAVFDLIRGYGNKAEAVLCAFDLLEVNGHDLRREPIEKRKELLATLLEGSHRSLVLNEHFEEDGEIVFREACKLGCEGIVSKRLGSTYRSGRSAHWVKVKIRKRQPRCAKRKKTGAVDLCQAAAFRIPMPRERHEMPRERCALRQRGRSGARSASAALVQGRSG